MASGLSRLQQLTMFNMLRSLDQYQLNQLNQMLYANQAVVPEATPVPGFESKTQHLQFATQQQNIPLAAAARKPFMNDLCDLDDLSVSCLFDGPDADNLPDPDRMFRCIEEEELASAITQVPVKEEAVSPRPWTSEDCSVMYEGSPQSPCMSDAGTSIYSTDDGFHSDSNSSVDELFDADVGGSPPSFYDEGVCVEPCKSAVVKEEPLPKTAPVKPVTRRRRGPKPPAMYSGTGPIQLWQFLLVLLTSTEHKGLIRWTQEEDFEFKILKPTTVATMWGKKKNKPTMNYEKLSRGLRYYYGKSIIEKVHGKRYVYQFICDIPKILGYNPMDNKPDEFAEDSVCGEPELSPEVEDLEVTSSGYTSMLVAQSFDLSELLKL